MNTHTFSLATDLSPWTGRHLDGHKTNGSDWPDSAQFALVLRYAAWPCGWSAVKHVDFFDTRDQLTAKVAELHRYAELEDNHVAYQGYEWDLGPNEMPDIAHNTGNL